MESPAQDGDIPKLLTSGVPATAVLVQYVHPSQSLARTRVFLSTHTFKAREAAECSGGSLALVIFRMLTERPNGALLLANEQFQFLIEA